MRRQFIEPLHNRKCLQRKKHLFTVGYFVTFNKHKIMFCRSALASVPLSDDPVRHAVLTEDIVSCFNSPAMSTTSLESKKTGVDFEQFAAVMSNEVTSTTHTGN